ncbi:MAG TPA: trypsin-like serine protease [Nocardioidaceae bacterium]|nr:trypsin-like serine protease [Nocardioidaceae bacterium]
MRRATMARASIMALVAAMVVTAAPAAAIIGGTPDGQGHPNVGALDVRPTGLRIPASGVLISPTVYVTAGHVTRFFDNAGVTRARVTFDPVYSDSATFFEGTVHTHPSFGAFPGRNDPYDIGVVVFDEPVPGITPATLPTAGLLDELGAQGLGDEVYPVVGYGITRLLGGADGGGTPRPDRDSAGTRKTGEWRFLSLTPDWIRFDMGDAQGCTGDSGAPNFLGESSLVVGIGIGGDAACSTMGSDLRLDTARARAFLGQFVDLP